MPTIRAASTPSRSVIIRAWSMGFLGTFHFENEFQFHFQDRFYVVRGQPVNKLKRIRNARIRKWSSGFTKTAVTVVTSETRPLHHGGTESRRRAKTKPKNNGIVVVSAVSIPSEG